MDLEKRLERLEGMMKGLWIGFAVGLAVAGLACLLSLVALLRQPPAPSIVGQPPEGAAPDKSKPPETRKPSYLDELERLEALKAKGAISQKEFDAKKQELLAAAPPPVADKASGVDELDKLLRDAQALFNKNIININDYQTKKQQYLQRKVTVSNLVKDLETVQKLFDENILNINEYQVLKQAVLAADPAVGKK